MYEFFNFTGISATCAHGWRTHIHDEAVAISKGEQFCPVLPHICNRGINMARNLHTSNQSLPKCVV